MKFGSITFIVQDGQMFKWEK
ncbi:DUF2292 domain-containing protein [Bacillus sp. A015]